MYRLSIGIVIKGTITQTIVLEILMTKSKEYRPSFQGDSPYIFFL